MMLCLDIFEPVIIFDSNIINMYSSFVCLIIFDSNIINMYSVLLYALHKGVGSD